MLQRLLLIVGCVAMVASAGCGRAGPAAAKALLKGGQKAGRKAPGAVTHEVQAAPRPRRVSNGGIDDVIRSSGDRDEKKR